MKRCPNCSTDYYDEMLEFCIEDGAKLFVVSKTLSETPTVTGTNRKMPFTEETLNLPFADEKQTIERVKANDVKTIQQNEDSIGKFAHAGSKVLEIAPVIFALAHNWWQWLYTINQPYNSISSFLISGSFLTWILLLAAGLGISLLAVKNGRNKGFGYASLVILAINLILFIVPKR